jgi:hypothetical protein
VFDFNLIISHVTENTFGRKPKRKSMHCIQRPLRTFTTRWGPECGSSLASPDHVDSKQKVAFTCWNQKVLTCEHGTAVPGFVLGSHKPPQNLYKYPSALSPLRAHKQHEEEAHKLYNILENTNLFFRHIFCFLSSWLS